MLNLLVLMEKKINDEPKSTTHYHQQPELCTLPTLLPPCSLTSLSGLHLRLGSWCDDFPFLYASADGSCRGSNLDLLDLMAASNNFTYEVQVGSEGTRI